MRKQYKDGIHVTIYSSDFPTHIWKEYCGICGIPTSSESITINTFDIVYEDKDEVYVHPGQTTLFDTPAAPVDVPGLDIPCDLSLLDMEVGEA